MRIFFAGSGIFVPDPAIHNYLSFHFMIIPQQNSLFLLININGLPVYLNKFIDLGIEKLRGITNLIMMKLTGMF
jgi:hypothetical protein